MEKEFRKLVRKTLKEEYGEQVVKTSSILDGMSNDKARKTVNSVANKAYHTGLYSDEYWQGKSDILNAFKNAGIEYEFKGSEYSPEFPNKWKTWTLSFPFTNNNGIGREIIGTITAAGAGSVEYPLDRYDITFTAF